FALTALTMLLTASVSVLASVMSSRTLHALLGSYGAIIGLALLHACSIGLLTSPWLNIGIFWCGGSTLVVLQATVAGLCISGAVARLRSAATQTRDDTWPPKPVEPRPEPRPPTRAPSRPPVTDHPLLWKEMADGRMSWDEPRNLQEFLRPMLTLLL